MGIESRIRIPFAAKAADAQPLRRCIEHAAEKSGLCPFQVAIVASHFWEALADAVSANKVVDIPGLGRFGPLAWTPRKPGLPSFCYPAFSASRAFRRQVSLCCPPTGPALESVRRHRRHHHLSSRPGRRSLPTSALRAFRVRILSQAREAGMTFDARDGETE